MYDPAEVNFCLCKAWCAINLLNPMDCSVDIIPSRALNRIVGVIDDSVEMDVGFLRWGPSCLCVSREES
jgi:hypothetical protein